MLKFSQRFGIVWSWKFPVPKRIIMSCIRIAALFTIWGENHCQPKCCDRRQMTVVGSSAENMVRCQSPFVKTLSAPYRACIALPDEFTVYAFTTQNRGLWSVSQGVSISGMPYPIYRFVGANHIPLCSFQKRKARAMVLSGRIWNAFCIRPGSNLLPENSGYVATWAMLCKVTFQIEPLSSQ